MVNSSEDETIEFARKAMEADIGEKAKEVKVCTGRSCRSFRIMERLNLK